MVHPTLLAAGLFALAVTMTPATALAAPAGLEIRQAGDVRFVSGGIGDDQQQALEAMAKDFNLEVTFAVAEGNYHGAVDFEIAKAGSNAPLVSTTTKGPIFLADLPAGQYEIRATPPGEETATKTVQVAEGKRASAVFHMGHVADPPGAEMH